MKSPVTRSRFSLMMQAAWRNVKQIPHDSQGLCRCMNQSISQSSSDLAPTDYALLYRIAYKNASECPHDAKNLPGPHEIVISVVREAIFDLACDKSWRYRRRIENERMHTTGSCTFSTVKMTFLNSSFSSWCRFKKKLVPASRLTRDTGMNFPRCRFH